ncbi:MAG TPA: hypothetical protein VE988_10160 [Gemmataceae bacterium]|nr:hypothetical protein [Gemmataceae bacterium]
MNITLKILAAVALVVVILAGGAYLLQRFGGESAAQNKDGNDGPKNDGSPTAPIAAAPKPKEDDKPHEVKADDPIQPKYKAVNQPAALQNLRQEGKTYKSIVVGKLSGQFSHKDYTLRKRAYFNYFFTVESHGKILKNDGYTIIEERHFNNMNENLVITGYEIQVELPPTLQMVLSWLGPITQAATGVNVGAANMINNVPISVKKEWVDSAQKMGLFKQLPLLDPSKMHDEFKFITRGKDSLLLEGKTVKITFVDGRGIILIEPVGCSLSLNEHEAVKRSNFIMDHYIMPNREIAVGQEWTVPGHVFGGFLDPRLRGKPDGEVKVVRELDFKVSDKSFNRFLKITQGTIKVEDVDGSRKIVGEMTGLTGRCKIPSDVNVVTDAHLDGYANYQNLQRDHILFGAEFAGKTRFEVKYSCTVE